ncbi:MAG: hypothetical protein M3Q07_19690 [Pseudobdellovibrionaceae bacterium]|nr:hypothetical protein [Pseudobdellovibrionaceae bacterium]
MKLHFKLVTQVSIILAFGLLMAHCGRPEPESSELDAGAPALRINGAWRMVSYKGSYVQNPGTGVATDVPTSRTFTTGSRNIVSAFNIDSAGNGSIQGKETCKLNVSQAKDTAASIQKSRVLNAAEGVVGLIQAVLEVKSMFDCRPGEVKDETVSVSQKRGFFGRPDPRLPLNVGVMGENRGNADNECNLMRGVRYVRIGQADACIGYNNAQATELKILLQRAGEIRVQRVILRRP